MLWVLQLHPIAILPKPVLPAQIHAIREMVNLLVLIQLDQILSLGVPRPDEVIVTGLLYHLEASILHGVHHRIVHVGPVRVVERHEQVLDVPTAVVGLHQVHVVELRLRDVHVRGVREVNCRGTPFELRFYESNFVTCCFEDGVGQFSLFTLQECGAYWVFY